MAVVDKIPHVGDVVCAIIERSGRFLIAQRPLGKSLASMWEFPGGKIKSNESEQTALQRELREELNVQVEILLRLTPCFHAYSNFSLRLIPYLCTLKEGEPEALEHKALRWITPYEISLYDFPEADLPVLAEYLALLNENRSDEADGLTP